MVLRQDDAAFVDVPGMRWMRLGFIQRATSETPTIVRKDPQPTHPSSSVKRRDQTDNPPCITATSRKFIVREMFKVSTIIRCGTFD